MPCNVGCLKLVLVTLILCCARIAPAEPPDSTPTGDVAEYIGERVPPAPPGFTTTLETFLAIPLGKVQGVNITARAPGARVRRNIRYSGTKETPLTLDLYRPKDRHEVSPGVILVHGGAWTIGSKRDYAFYACELAKRGYVVACINYRKAPRHRFPACVQDVKAAVRWMRARSKRYQIDPNRIAVVGGSAGGHLALMAGYAHGIPQFESGGRHAGMSSEVQCVVALYPPTDLATISPRIRQKSTLPSPLLAQFLGGSYHDIPETYSLASPLAHLTADAPPTLILHGTIDGLVPVQQSDLLAEKLAELNVPYVYDRLPGWPHAMDLVKPVNDRFLFLLERFLAKSLNHTDPAAIQLTVADLAPGDEDVAPLASERVLP